MVCPDNQAGEAVDIPELKAEIGAMCLAAVWLLATVSPSFHYHHQSHTGH
jgi:hypothetical protein